MTALADDNDLEVSLLERYCAETASADEAARIEAWFREHSDRRIWYEEFKMALKKDYPLMSEEKVSAALTRFLQAALQRHPASDGEQGGVRRSGDGTVYSADQVPPEYLGRKLSTGPQTFRVAGEKEGGFSGRTLRRGVWPPLAWLTLGVAAIVVAWTLGGVAHRGSGTASPLEYATENGERAHITLPDGNTVSLNVGSHLDVPADYASGDHVVRLVGEALFDVSHRRGAPFTVVAGAATTRVLGTSFVVRHYRTDTTTLIVVRDGKVAVGSTVATAQRWIEVGQSGMTRVGVADPSLFSFATGVLAIDSTRLSEAIPELNRWYDVDIRLGDPALAAQSIDGRFTAGSVSGLVEILEGTYDMHVMRNGRVLTLYLGTQR